VTVDLREAPAAVAVEVVTLTCPSAAQLGYRVRAAALGGGETPDDAARRLAPASALEVLHSTSWRFEAGRVVLTYAAVPAAPAPHADVIPLQEPSVLSSGDPLVPAPPALHLHHVVAHAVRHLAQLAEHDPGVRAAAARSEVPEVWSAITEAAREMPTGTHAATHRAAIERATKPRQTRTQQPQTPQPQTPRP
jgi:hypothetical protein